MSMTGNPALTTWGGSQMLDNDDAALWYALHRLVVNYWAEVDENAGRRAHEFYVPGGLYLVGNSRFEGEEKIRAFYLRRGHGGTVTRHLISNLRAFRDDDDAGHARMAGLMSLYRADGKSPFQGARPPAMIADFEASCVLRDDRSWRFQSHVLRPFIVGADMPASIMIKPQAL
jgi:SnoaL-like protein